MTEDETHGKTEKPMNKQPENKEENTKSNDWCSIRESQESHSTPTLEDTKREQDPIRTELPALVFFSFKLLGFKRFGS
jgi:hypothetical protein